MRVGIKLFKDESTLFQRMMAIAVFLFLLSGAVFFVCARVLRHSNPKLSSLTDALATTEVGIVMSVVVIRSLLSGDVAYRPYRGVTLHEKRSERPIGFWCVLLAFVLLALGMVSTGLYNIAHWRMHPPETRPSITNLDLSDHAKPLVVGKGEGKPATVKTCKSSEGSITAITIVQSSGDPIAYSSDRERTFHVIVNDHVMCAAGVAVLR